VRSCLIDGEAIVCDGNGLAVFDLIRGHRAVASAVHCAFDLLELDGKDLRRQPIEERKRLLAELLHDSHMSIVLNEHYEEDGAIVSLWRRLLRHDQATLFEHTCRQPLGDQPDDPSIANPMFDEADQPGLADLVEKRIGRRNRGPS
jgi:hypothetical protein